MRVIRKLFSSTIWGYGLFWSWNLIFLAFMGLGFAPQVLPEMVRSVSIGLIPVEFLIYAVILTLIPLAAVILGLTMLRSQPGQLLRLGYGVEGPLMLLLAVRFFAVREVTPGVAVLFTTVVLAIATLLWQLLDHRIDDRPVWLTYLRTIGATLLLIMGIYAGVWLAFYAVPLAAGLGQLVTSLVRNITFILQDLWRGLARFDWRDVGLVLTGLPFFFLGSLLMLYSATLFIGMPVVVPVLYIRAWWRSMRRLSLQGRWTAAGLVMAVLIVWAVLFGLINHQPQGQAFALLKTPPASPAQARALLTQQETIRAGLLNAYLAPYRYASAMGEVYHVSEMYKASLGLSPEQAAGVQQAYEVVVRPMLYEPIKARPSENQWDNRIFREEPQEAAELYESFFDQTISDGEHDAVVQAVRSTWQPDQAQAAWLAVDEREVRLNRQELTLTEHGDWADMELYEVYQNQTFERQEVVYYFSLPESAVITGLWLGNSANRAERFAYRVSPRGAAQQIYREERTIRFRDPALVEQIGPSQYRLRIFPVEPKTQSWEQGTSRWQRPVKEGPPLHMWLTWRTLARDNAWPLPYLAERRNIYWDEESVRLVNGQPLTLDNETWLPASVPAGQPVKPVAHRVDFANGQTVLARPATPADLPQPSGNLRLAVVLDRSRSMAGQDDNVQAALTRLRQLADAGATVDVYLTASTYRGEKPARVTLAQLTPDDLFYYGGQNAAELLTQFHSLYTGHQYDAVVVLTDGSGYELDDSGLKVAVPPAPLWMVHLGGSFPLGYDDPTLQAIQASGGGVVASLAEALTRLMLGRQEATFDVVDGYVWLTGPTGQVEAGTGEVVTHDLSDGFAALAGRRVILAEMVRHRGRLDQVDTLDQLHALAVAQSIVTPYSSMIVLVNEAQKQRLDELEAQADRFEREHEDVGQTLVTPPITGVPEPHEWLLLAMAALLLGWLYRKRRQTQLV